MSEETNVACGIEKCILNKVKQTLCSKDLPDIPVDLIATDNLSEVIEKLCILHIRTWFLEDMVGVAETDQEIASLKKKIDICFKQKRPQYVQAINRMIDAAIVDGKNLVEDSVKIYKGN